MIPDEFYAELADILITEAERIGREEPEPEAGAL
jgi:hypothetical protein